MAQFRVKRLVVFALLLGLVCVSPAVVATADTGRPTAAVDEPEHDFGSVFAGKNVLHSFVIKNTGDAPLTIGKVRTG